MVKYIRSSLSEKASKQKIKQTINKYLFDFLLKI